MLCLNLFFSIIGRCAGPGYMNERKEYLAFLVSRTPHLLLICAHKESNFQLFQKFYFHLPLYFKATHIFTHKTIGLPIGHHIHPAFTYKNSLVKHSFTLNQFLKFLI